MKNVILLLIAGFFLTTIPYTHAEPFTYHWEIDETPEGSESATVIDPVQVTLLDEQIQVPSHSASLALITLSKYAADGYWQPDQIRIWDAQGNERLTSQNDWGWKLYLDNPLADCEPPVYVKKSMRLSLSDATTEEGRPYQIVTARWKFIEKNGIRHVYAQLNDLNRETYSRRENYGEYNPQTGEASVGLIFPDYFQSGTYSLNYLGMVDVAKPDNTQLLANFPNPLNPETWIPYQLGDASNVQITIYDTRGTVVRTLRLGHQSAGYYTGRSRAAYWNGQNSLGENVASGVYFYQLKTDEISRLRKMVIRK